MTRHLGTITLLALGVLAGAHHLPAQAMAGTRVGIAAGMSIPSGTFGNRVNSGPDVAGSVEFHPRRGSLGLRAELSYSDFGLTDGYLARFSGANDGNASILAGTLNLVYDINRGGRLRPYLIGGAGVYRRHVEVDRPDGLDVATVFDPFFGFVNEVFPTEAVERSRTQTKFGLNGGGGLTMSMGPTSLFAEARYHDAFTGSRHTAMVPIRIGVQW
jgi:opacity protein-like surface antigen